MIGWNVTGDKKYLEIQKYLGLVFLMLFNVFGPADSELPVMGRNEHSRWYKNTADDSHLHLNRLIHPAVENSRELLHVSDLNSKNRHGNLIFVLEVEIKICLCPCLVY